MELLWGMLLQCGELDCCWQLLTPSFKFDFCIRIPWYENRLLLGSDYEKWVQCFWSWLIVVGCKL